MKTTILSAKRLNNLSYKFHKKYTSEYDCSKAIKNLESKGYEVRVIGCIEGITRYQVYYVYTRKKNSKSKRVKEK